MEMTRRAFLATAAAGAGKLALAGNAGAEPAEAVAPGSGPVLVSTWPAGLAVNLRAAEVLASGGGLLDAIEQGIMVSESDRDNSSVGLGGHPNADGIVQLDACIMYGPGHRAGSVAALEGIAHPITAARRVMEVSPHVMLVGDGARQFALRQGLAQAELLTPERRQQWEEWRQRQDGGSPAPRGISHDTMTLVGLDEAGNLAGGCSTSGWAYKLPGRIGDSPIIGSGLYVDNEVGAAGATGQGEIIMQTCGAFLVVELMRQGRTPAEACAEAVRRVVTQVQRHPAWGASVDLVAVDRFGRTGAAGTDEAFRSAVTTGGETRLETPVCVQP